MDQMIEFDDFKILIDEIEAQGYDRETAGEYAALLGDTPLYNEAGDIVVMEGDRIVATLKPLKFYEG
jgi:hypothetical protein